MGEEPTVTTQAPVDKSPEDVELPIKDSPEDVVAPPQTSTSKKEKPLTAALPDVKEGNKGI